MSFRNSKQTRIAPSYARPSMRQQDTGRDPFRARGFVVARAFVLGIFAIVGVSIVAMVLAGGFWTTSTMQDCRVVEKSVAVVDGYSEYRVHTANCDVLTVADSLVDGQYNAATVYGNIHEGKTYDFGTRGLRVPFFSLFPNIISVQQTS